MSAPQRRDAVRLLQERKVSQRQGCRLAGISRMGLRYRPAMQAKNEALRERLWAISKKRKRYGFRRAWAELRREGHVVNRKRIHRLWKEEGLHVPRRKKRCPWRSGAFLMRPRMRRRSSYFN